MSRHHRSRLARVAAAVSILVAAHVPAHASVPPVRPDPPQIVPATVPRPDVHPNVWAVSDAVTWIAVENQPPPEPPPPDPVPVVVHHHPSTTTAGSHHGYPSARECVAWTENGGDYGRSSNPSHFGRYQFSRSAWISFGGDPGTWGTASPAEQDAVFDTAWSQGPAVQEQQWLRWDGC